MPKKYYFVRSQYKEGHADCESATHILGPFSLAIAARMLSIVSEGKWDQPDAAGFLPKFSVVESLDDGE